MSTSAISHPLLDVQVADEPRPVPVPSPSRLDAAIDRLFASPGCRIEALGVGAPLQAEGDALDLRNRLFQRLVAAHGFSAIAIESSFPRARVVNEYVLGRAGASYDAVQAAGFSHGLGRLEGNRALVEWMRQYNADPANAVKLQFHGFETPTETTLDDGARQVLAVVFDFLAEVDPVVGRGYRERIEPLLGDDAARLATEELVNEMWLRRPELARFDAARYAEAVHHARVARQLLSYHAAVARRAGTATLLGFRDAWMADNLVHVVSRERGRGKVLAFAPGSHLQRGKVQQQLGDELLTWWPAGAHLDEMLGSRYAVIA